MLVEIRPNALNSETISFLARVRFDLGSEKRILRAVPSPVV
jgi:hypothetical protein